jgi:hypothetical protein
MTDRELLKEVIEFRNLLIDFSHCVGDYRKQDEAAKLRTDLSIKWGRIETDLARIGFPRHLEQFGRHFPIMFLVLREPGLRGPDFETIQTVNQGLETAIGRLQRKIEEAPTARKSNARAIVIGIVGLIAVVIVWSFGRFHDEIWSALWRGFAWTWDQAVNGKLLWQSLATLALTVAGGITANRMHEDGIAGAVRRHPASTLAYLTATVAAIVSLVILA